MAERLAPSTKSVVEKLLLKSGARAAVLGAPNGYLRQFPRNMQIDQELDQASGEYDFIQAFTSRKDDLVALAPKIRSAAGLNSTIRPS